MTFEDECESHFLVAVSQACEDLGLDHTIAVGIASWAHHFLTDLGYTVVPIPTDTVHFDLGPRPLTQQRPKPSLRVIGGRDTE